VSPSPVADRGDEPERLPALDHDPPRLGFFTLRELDGKDSLFEGCRDLILINIGWDPE
jgi:hypothetical protein